MDFRIRSFNLDELPKLAELLNAMYKGSYEFVPFTVERLRSMVEERKLEVLVAEGGGVVLGCVIYGKGPWGLGIRWLAVSEGEFQKTIENALAEEVEKKAEGEVSIVIDAESPMMDFWVSRGYGAEGGLYHMVARLDGVKPLPKIPDAAVIRSLRPDEEKQLVETVNLAYGWERLKEGAIARWKTQNPPFNEDWIHVAEIGGKIVSAVVSRPDTEYNEFFKARRGYLGPAATLPEFRGKNLASALTRRAMNFLYERGMDAVALHTFERNIPSLTLLKRLGFEIRHHRKIVRKKVSN
jgi:ribosomal protein S18 acetylase RimI-like enzyme